jgi:hypothetical protein
MCERKTQKIFAAKMAGETVLKFGKIGHGNYFAGAVSFSAA